MYMWEPEKPVLEPEADRIGMVGQLESSRRPMFMVGVVGVWWLWGPDPL